MGFSAMLRVLLAVCLCVGSSAFASTLVINQVDWLQGSGGFLAQNSEWGIANFQFGPGDQGQFFPDGSGGFYGYLQLLTNPNAGSGSNNWAVQNKVMVFKDSSAFEGRLPDGITFNLGVPRGDDLTGNPNYRAYAIVTATPLATMPIVDISGEQYQVAVGKEQWVFGGGAFIGSNTRAGFVGEAGEVEPATAGDYLGAAPTDTKREEAKIKIKDEDVEKVKEELQGCGPGSAARSLRYLVKQGKIKVNKTAQQIYEDLKTKKYMNTDLGEKGKGTFNKPFVDGKNKYAKDNKLKVNTTERPCSVGAVALDLDNGEDFEILFSFGKNDNDKDLGGHIAFVAEIVYYENNQNAVTGYEIRVIDTKDQKDDAENRSHWFKFDKDDNLTAGANKGKGGKCTLFFDEAPSQ